MNNPYVQRVYQKLAHCRVLLSQVAQLGDSIPERQHSDALLQAGLLHLLIAYRFYLRELAHQYRLPHPDQITTLEALLKPSQLAAQVVPELEELARLELSGEWLALILDAEQEVLNPSMEAPVVQQSSLIAVSRVTSVPLTEVSLDQWLQAFCELVERQRIASAEF